MKKKKWILFLAILLFLAAAGVGLYLGTPSIPKRDGEKEAAVQSVASITGYAKDVALRRRFLGVLSQMGAVTVRLDEGRETKGFLVEEGDPVKEGEVLAVYDNTALLLEKEQLLLDREQLVFDEENTERLIQSLRRERRLADASRREELDLQILNAQAEQEQKDHEISRKDQEITKLEEKILVNEVVSPCEGVVTEAEGEGTLLIVPEGSYEFSFSVSEEELREFQAGDTMTVTSRDGLVSCEGTLSRIESGNPKESETASGAFRASLYPVHGRIMEAEGFLSGQHVYVEKKESAGEEEIPGLSEMEILLPEGYIGDVSGKPWVWAAGTDGRLEKRFITLGVYNDRHSAYQVTGGLSMTDYLAYPSALLTEGQKTMVGE